MLTAFLGNLLVCLTILKNRILRTPVNYLLMNLAISDLMIVISFTPRHILEGLYHHPRGLQGTLLCKTVTSDTFTWVGAVSSATTLVVLAYERYAAITFPLGTRSKLSCRKLKILVGLGWFFFRYLQHPTVLRQKPQPTAWNLRKPLAKCDIGKKL